MADSTQQDKTGASAPRFTVSTEPLFEGQDALYHVVSDAHKPFPVVAVFEPGEAGMAHILAWALNAIANGRQLGSRSAGPRSPHYEPRKLYEWYDGPTDGIRP